MQSFHAVQDQGKLDDYWLKTFNNVIKGIKHILTFYHYVIYNTIIFMMKC